MKGFFGCFLAAFVIVTPCVADDGLLAYWTFDDAAQLVANSAGGVVLAEAKSTPAHGRGVHGLALDLKGEQKIEVRNLQSVSPGAIAFSAWVKPADLSGFREIFRLEGRNEQRLLFSFQDNGNILSLSLNVGGYVECDANVRACDIDDGQWHFCAATFDGAAMRVYVDGKEMAALERKGTIAFDAEALGYIGSTCGTSEFYQGRLDDLRIYSRTLTPREIASQYEEGIAAIAAASGELEAAANAVYSAGPTFAESLANTCKKLSEQDSRPDDDVIGVVAARLHKAFASECEQFTSVLDESLPGVLLSKDGDVLARRAERLMDLLVEYRPLTEYQKKKQTPEDAAKWAGADQIRKRFDDLKAQGESARFSPEWIRLIIETGPRIQFRPHVNEAVAPYVRPETPVTRELTSNEAQEALERDWLFQADGQPTPARILKEIAWARELAQRLARNGAANLEKPLEELNECERTAASLADADPRLYYRVRAAKRAIVFQNPVLDFQKMLLVDMPYPAGSEWPHETRHRLGYMAVPGGRLLVLDGLRPDGKVRQLMPQLPLHGTFWRPDVSFDATKIVCCFKPHNEKAFHLYETGVDGGEPVQLTDGIYDDLDPVYLPDGHILFSTTRGHTYVRCMPPTNAFVLARCDADGRNVYLVSYNNEPDYLPSVMNDGRVVYTRWEYTDKPLWRAQKLWTMNPDGTQVSTLWGNQSVWPDVMKDARAIPGSRRIIFTGSAHHNWFGGSVGIIDPDKGFNFPNGLTKITADVTWPECGNGPVDPIESTAYHAGGAYGAYYSPYPLSEQDFIVSAERDKKFRLYLMDVNGNRELIYEGVNNVFHAMPLRPRPKPPVIADRVAWPAREDRLHPKDGVIYSNNVYQGAPEELKGKAKFLRIMHIEPKTYTYWYKRPYISTGPVVSAVQSEGVKQILGTVPIAPDGSVCFAAPAGKSLHFQLLDEEHRALQTMRSFVGVLPGERRGCLGCHESHSKTPVSSGNAEAFAAGPVAITPPPWSDTTVSYPRYVRPVLDKYCAKCHEGDGDARKTFDMTERPTDPIFTEPYMTIIGRPSWGAPYVKPAKHVPGFGIANTLIVEGFGQFDPSAYTTPKPLTCLSYNSPLIEIASSGKHHDVRVDAISLERLKVWVDAMCPYCGSEEVRAIDDPEFQGVDWIAIRPLIKNAPTIVRPGPVD